MASERIPFGSNLQKGEFTLRKDQSYSEVNNSTITNTLPFGVIKNSDLRDK